jgi:hypothetical protein
LRRLEADCSTQNSADAPAAAIGNSVLIVCAAFGFHPHFPHPVPNSRIDGHEPPPPPPTPTRPPPRRLRRPPSTLRRSGWTRTAACAPRASTTRRSAPKATRSRPVPAAAAAALTSFAACATDAGSASTRCSGACAAWRAAAEATPCARLASRRSAARLLLEQGATISPRWCVARAGRQTHIVLSAFVPLVIL